MIEDAQNLPTYEDERRVRAAVDLSPRRALLELVRLVYGLRRVSPHASAARIDAEMIAEIIAEVVSRVPRSRRDRADIIAEITPRLSPR